MASPHTERTLPYLPREIWSKILAEVSYHRDFRELAYVWTQYRRVSSVFKSEIERTLIQQHLKRPTIYVKLLPMLSALIFNSTKTSPEEMIETDGYEHIELVHSCDVLVPLRFHQLSANENEITFRYHHIDAEPDGWPNFEHLSDEVMLRPFSMFMHSTLQHLPVQVEWVNRNEQVTLSLTFDWKQLFSMFITRETLTYNQYFVYGRFRFAPPCRWRYVDGTARMCMEHGADRRYLCPLP